MTPSKTCSACGWQNPRLPLADRTFHCDECGLRIDRDTNAARNIAAHAAVSGTQPAKRSPPVARRPKTPAEHPSDFPAPGVGSRTRRNGKTPGPPVRRAGHCRALRLGTGRGCDLDRVDRVSAVQAADYRA
ncbi:zinc ribbon domain-containing protein [Streptomyces sp. NPDC057557]|uniref:zinc ribbon domain-containing protein n=1 Tax=Streptomyces sp. NPDC057557 TaxID=3346167 RepID=UPI0036988236